MKNVKTILVVVGAIAFLGSLVAFTNRFKQEGDDKCHLKIVKVINGVETVVDSTFDCSEDLSWATSFHENIGADSIHKMIKMMMVEGDSNEFTFDFNFEMDENNTEDIHVMRLGLAGDDGEEKEMKFEFKTTEGEDGKMKMMINGKELEIEMDQLHEHLEKLHEHMGVMNEETGNISMVFETKEDGKGAHVIKITKEIDDEGNVTMKKIVDGKEVEIDEAVLNEMNNQHRVMFISDGKEHKGSHEVTIDVEVNDDETKASKHIVIITKILGDDDLAKQIPSAKKNLKKEELAISKLKFSPNPNNGKFDLSFKLNQTEPVSIKILDMQGKVVYDEQISNFSGKYQNNIDISEKGEGIYILQIIQNNKASTHKIVIK